DYAAALRKNANDIRDSNNQLRSDIDKTKDSILENNDDIVISMGKFGNITQEELEKAGPMAQALIKYFKELNQEAAKSAEISKNLGYQDPIIAMGKQATQAQNEQQKKLTEIQEKESKKRLFIEIQNNKKKMAFQQTVAEAEKAFNENRTTALKSYSDGFINEMKKQKTVFEQLNEAGANAFNGLTNALTDFVMTGKFKFKDFANMIIRDLVRIAAQAAVTFAIKKAAAAFGGPFGFLAGFLAEGGPAQAGKPYVVGEKGPELFIPNSSGNVISNEDLQKTSGSRVGGKEIQVNFNVTAMDAESFQGKLAEQRDTIVSIINEAVADSGRAPITA
ncbi:MAG: phage tail tape measure C-terminal domain-containing protein, partial [Candidatus Poseidoniales archaeon]